MADSHVRNPKRLIHSDNPRKPKRKKKDPRLNALMKHLALTVADADYIAKRHDAEEYLIVLDHITAAFREVRGEDYPDFQQVNQNISNMDIFRDAIHPIA